MVISNQGDGREKVRSEWRAKLALIAAKVSDSRTWTWLKKVAYGCADKDLSGVIEARRV